MRFQAVLIVLALLAPAVTAQDEEPRLVARLRVTSVEQNRPIAKGGEWIRCGVPLAPQIVVKDASTLRLEGDAGPIPARIRVMTRRGGKPKDLTKPIAWLELTFAARPEHGTELRIVEGKRPKGDISWRKGDAGRLTIDRGQLSMTLDPESMQLLTSLTSELLPEAAAASLQPKLSQKQVEDVGGDWRLAIESADDAAIDILATAECGIGRAIGGGTDVLRFEVRLQLVTGSDEVVIDTRLVNHGPYGHMGTASEHRYFEWHGITLPGLPATRVLDASAILDSPEVWGLMQTQVLDWNDKVVQPRFMFQLWEFDREINDFRYVHAGARTSGVVVLEKDDRSLGYMIEDFWQNSPKAIRGNRKSVTVELFARGGAGPFYRGKYGRPPTTGEVDPKSLKQYRFEGGRAKSHRIVMVISDEKAESIRDRLLIRDRAPLHASVPPEDIAGLDIMGYQVLPTGSLADPVAQRFERFGQILVDDSAADFIDALGQIGLPAFIERGGTYGRQVFRGWFNHGDIAWGDGYSSLHYDLPFSMLFHYLRSGDPRFLAMGEDMSRHRRDIDQDHDTTSDIKQRGGQFYEKGWWHGNYYHPHVSHTWPRGPLLHWLLTGDRWSLEAAMLNRDFIHRSGIGHWNGDWGSRIPGWGADHLLAFYELFGESRDLEEAEAGIAAFEKVESQRDGKKGFVLNKRMKPISCKPWMIAIMGNAVARHAIITGSDRFVPLLNRICGFLGGPALEDATADLPRVWRNWKPAGGDRAEHHLAWGPAATLALAAEATGSQEQRALARRLFASACLRHAEKPGAPIAFRMLAYPNAESKIHGTIQIWGLLALPALLDR